MNSSEGQFRAANSFGGFSGHKGYMWPTPISNMLQAKGYGSPLQLLQPGGDQAGAEGAIGQTQGTPWTLGHTGLVSPSLVPQEQPGETKFMSKEQEVRGLN